MVLADIMRLRVRVLCYRVNMMDEERVRPSFSEKCRCVTLMLRAGVRWRTQRPKRKDDGSFLLFLPRANDEFLRPEEASILHNYNFLFSIRC